MQISAHPIVIMNIPKLTLVGLPILLLHNSSIMQISKNEENQPSWNPCKKEIKLKAYL